MNCNSTKLFSSLSNHRFRLLLICILLTACPNVSIAQSVEYIVFSIKGQHPNLSLGQLLKEGDRIELPDNVEVKLLSKDGNYTRLAGPLSATVTNDGENVNGESALSTISNKLFASGGFVDILGASRSVDGQVKISDRVDGQQGQDPWSPTLSADANYCLKFKSPVLYRVDDASQLRIQVNGNSSDKQEIIWDANRATIDLGQHMNLNADSYTFLIQGRASPVNIHLLQTEAGVVSQQIAWLAEHGCIRQAALLLYQAK